jgi:uncharacterized membrane protein YtjA (UPF0391 family)
VGALLGEKLADKDSIFWNRKRPTGFGGYYRSTAMLYWALVFLVIALVAAALGFGGIAGASAGIAQILFFIFLVLLIVSLVAHFARGSRVP